MNLARDEPSAILSKSLVLAEKTTNRLHQIDQSHFPTDSSMIARQLLLKVLDALRDPPNFGPMDPSVLYNRLIALQELCDLVARSSVDSISWPLVGYCDAIWEGFFGPGNPKIFYSVTPEHNYSIFGFSQYIANLLDGLLPPGEIQALIDGCEIYCLQLASVEDDNLPLYAIIGHEFGHAVFSHREQEILQTLGNRFGNVMQQIHTHFQNEDSSQAQRRLSRIIVVVRKTAEELFCDMAGAMLMGPAFFLSSYEMSWGHSRSIFQVLLAPSDRQTRAYPSNQFRLSCVRDKAGVQTFCDGAVDDFKKLSKPEHRELYDCLSTIPTSHSSDQVNVWPVSDQDSLSIRHALESNLSAVKTSLEGFLEDIATQFTQWYPDNITSVNTDEVYNLLLRLEHSILPNVTPDTTLRGKPAEFTAILNASALYRMHLLVNGTQPNSEPLSKWIGIVERLTAKALEVSFVQKKYNEWPRS